MALEKRHRVGEEAMQGGGEQNRQLSTRAGAFQPVCCKGALLFVRICACPPFPHPHAVIAGFGIPALTVLQSCSVP